MTKKVLVGLPPSLLEGIDYAAQAECRTRSDLIREALRRYLDNFHRQRLLQPTPANISMLEGAYAASSPSTGMALAVTHRD